MIEILAPENEDQLSLVRDLFHQYGIARGFDVALGDFETEIKNLPGKYNFPEGALFLALDDDNPAGCIAYQKLSEKICEMKRMYVLDDFRQRGIGMELTITLLDQARTQGYRSMRLDSHPSMTEAHALYEKLGFHEIERYNQNPIPGIRFFEKEL